MASTLFERTPHDINKDAWIYPSRGAMRLVVWHEVNGRRACAHVDIKTKWMRRLLFRLSMEVGKQKARAARRASDRKRKGER